MQIRPQGQGLVGVRLGGGAGHQIIVQAMLTRTEGSIVDSPVVRVLKTTWNFRFKNICDETLTIII